MTLSERDVLQRRDRNRRLVTWVSQSLLLQICDGLTEDTLRETCRKRYKQTVQERYHKQDFLLDTKTAWRWAHVGGIFYYDYDRIGEGYQKKLPGVAKLVQLHAEARKKGFKSELKTEILNKAFGEVYKNYLRSYSGYDNDKTVQLAKAAAVLEVAVEWMRETGYATHKSGFFVELVEICKEVPYLPSHYRVLKAKVLEVWNGKPVTDVVDLPRLGNSNAKKYDDPELIAWLLQMRNMPQNYTNSHITRKLRKLCELYGKAAPSASWFDLEFAKPYTKFLTAEGRHGKNGRKGAMWKGYISFEAAMFAGDCWQADGTRVNLLGFYVESTIIDKNGKEKKIKGQVFLYIIAIRDVYSGDIIGWHLDTKEDRWGYICAMKMAVSMTGKLPYELVIDRFPGHNTEEWEAIQNQMERLGTTVTVSSASTGKAKIERMFGTMQTVFMQDSEYYYGEGVQSRRAYAHRSAEYIARMQKKARNEGWNFDTAYAEALRIIEAYRSTPLCEYSDQYAKVQQSPRELHQQCEKPHMIEIPIWSQIGLFGLEKEVTIARGGKIKTTVQGVDYIYNVEDYDTLSQHKKVRLCYDMEDFGTVYLFENSDDSGRAYLGEATEQRAVKRYGPNADWAALAKAKERNKRIEDRRKADLASITAEGSEVAILLGSYSTKDDTSNAETRWLMERAQEVKDTGKPRVLNPKIDIESDDDSIDFDVRRMY